MRFTRFVMSDGPAFTLPEEQAYQVLTSENQLAMIKGKDGKWTGKTINKAHIVSTEPDRDAEREWRRDHMPKLQEPKEVITPEQQRRIEQKRREISEMLRVKR